MTTYISQDFVQYTQSGTDLPNQPMYGTVANCQIECNRNSSCVGFSRSKHIADANGDGQCYLKVAFPNKTSPDWYWRTFVKVDPCASANAAAAEANAARDRANAATTAANSAAAAANAARDAALSGKGTAEAARDAAERARAAAEAMRVAAEAAKRAAEAERDAKAKDAMDALERERNAKNRWKPKPQEMPLS